MLKIILIFFMSTLSIYAKADSSLSCKSEIVKNRGKSVTELVDGAETIVFARATAYVHDDSKKIFAGYYIFNIVDNIKGEMISTIKVWGREPYERIPKSYIDITLIHNNLNLDSLYGGATGILLVDDNCTLAPQFYIGWNYLIFDRILSEFSYEPINSPSLDKFFKAVYSNSNNANEK
ncbi:hypothetical protein [Alteromonas sp. 14N.309.X.WAT.G.H12]|uniref:hypothetical protein n=1 Tax=Alteromonas sp. 14N.309.X.WAT.G.H12 TaxID=3120824 RepID=UPI002FD57572